MSEGELLQIEKARRLDITEEVYFDIIQRKTASLIAACCACGAASVRPMNKGNAEDVERMRKFGELVGLAFQIKDDLLDLGEGERIGKPTGGDIRERKMTLPLIHTLQVASPSERRRLIRLVKYRNNDNAAVQEVMDAIIQGPGMEYARGKMRALAQEALELLDSYPESAAKTALVDLVEFTMERKR
jgi:octaprenyl-diphosphate synthase